MKNRPDMNRDQILNEKENVPAPDNDILREHRTVGLGSLTETEKRAPKAAAEEQPLIRVPKRNVTAELLEADGGESDAPETEPVTADVRRRAISIGSAPEKKETAPAETPAAVEEQSFSRLPKRGVTVEPLDTEAEEFDAPETEPVTVDVRRRAISIGSAPEKKETAPAETPKAMEEQPISQLPKRGVTVEPLDTEAEEFDTPETEPVTVDVRRRAISIGSAPEKKEAAPAETPKAMEEQPISQLPKRGVTAEPQETQEEDFLPEEEDLVTVDIRHRAINMGSLTATEESAPQEAPAPAAAVQPPAGANGTAPKRRRRRSAATAAGRGYGTRQEAPNAASTEWQPPVTPPLRTVIYRQPEEEKPEPLPQVVQPAVPSDAFPRADAPDPIKPGRTDADPDGQYEETEYGDEEYDEMGDDDRPVWPRVLLTMLVVLLLLLAVLYFVPSAGPLQPVKDAVQGAVDSVRTMVGAEKKAPAEALSFQTLTNSAMTGGKVTFNATTSKSVEDVRLENGLGIPLTAEAVLINGEGETNKIWEITAFFEEPYEGEIFLSMKNKDEWARSDKSIPMKITEPTPAPTAVPTVEPTAVPTVEPTAIPTAEPTAVPTAVPTAEPDTGLEEDPDEWPDEEFDEEPVEVLTVEPIAEPDDAPTNAPVVIPVMPTWAPAPTATAAPTQEPAAVLVARAAAAATATPTPAAAVTEQPTPAPTEAPTPAPTAEPAATVEPTLPRLTASSNLTLKNTDTVYIGAKKQSSFSREKGYVAPNPDRYSPANYGVLTFRGDNFRRNAASGTAEIVKEKMEVLWDVPLGSLRTADSGTLYGVGWTGQPAIVKWPKESREMMNLYENKKSVSALREVIFGAQDGKIYFLDLTDGTATRDPINVGYPLKGSVAVDSYCRPLLAVGQGISKLPNKTGSIGLHVYNLISGERELMINGRKNDKQVQYGSNGAFDGTPLFLYENDAMVVAGENGLLYTVDLNSQFTYPRKEDPDAKGSLTVNPSVTYLRTKSGNEKDSQVSVESSVAMYDKYVYTADGYGILRCVDTDTMETVWNFDAGDNTDAAIALEMETTGTVSLYTGNTAADRLTKKDEVTIRKMDALTGQQLWTYSVKCVQDKKSQLSGCKASPIVGQQSINGLVIFTVNMLEDGGSRVVALEKATGREVWAFSMSEEAVSSPVAVYNENGDAWIIQADRGGTLHLLRGLTGMERYQLELGGDIQGSPAVYKDILVIGTCDKNAAMYGIKLY